MEEVIRHTYRMNGHIKYGKESSKHTILESNTLIKKLEGELGENFTIDLPFIETGNRYKAEISKDGYTYRIIIYSRKKDNSIGFDVIQNPPDLLTLDLHQDEIYNSLRNAFGN